MAEAHPHFCDCLTCLGPAIRVPGVGAVLSARSRQAQLPPPSSTELRDRTPVLTFSPELTDARNE